VAELFQRIEALFEHDGLASNGTTSCIFLFFKLVENLLALLPCAISEEKSAMSLQIRSDSVCVWPVRCFFIVAESDTDDFVLSHEEFGIGECFSEWLEIVGAHIVEGEDVEVLELVEEAVHLLDDELFVLSHFGLDLGERDHLVLLGERHQQSIL